MKKISSIITVLALGIFASFADTPSQPQQPQRPVRTDVERPITLKNVQTTSSNKMRTPAMPIYGYYDGEILSIEFMVAEDSEVLSVYYHCEDDVVYEEVCTAMELKQGITVSIDVPFWIEVITESGAVYKEYNNDIDD